MILLLLMMLFGRESKAQAAEGCGTSYWDAIPVAFSVGKATFTDVRDTSTGPPWYYRPDGQPVVAIMSGDIQTRFYYDKYGRRIAIKAPSAGVRRTAYDKAGNVSKETDADGRELVKEYDRYGRVVKQITPDLTTVYTYDNTENLLLSAVSSNGSALYNTYFKVKS